MSKQSTGYFVGSSVASGSAEGVTAEGAAFVSGPGHLRYVRTRTPEAGQAQPLVPGVMWGRIPLPLDLNHINVWLLDAGDGWVIVDTGVAAQVGKSAWEAIEGAHFAGKPVRAIFVTHIHPDHIGLAGWLQQRYDVPVLMSRRTHELAEALLAGVNAWRADDGEAFFRAHGIADVEPLRGLFSSERFARLASGMPRVERFVADGEPLPLGCGPWTALQTDGHAEGHICLFNSAARILISGDQVLPTISSNIGLSWRSVDLNPLHSYLTSLERLSALDKQTLVLPSHGVPFYGLKQRASDLRRHHEEQLAALMRACAEPKTAADVLPVMFRRELKGMHLFFALSEAAAHLEYLAHAERVSRHVDSAGAIRYSTRP